MALVMALALAGCGSSEDEAGPLPAKSSDAPPSEEDEVSDAYQRYWDVTVQMSNSGEVSAAPFEGVASGNFVEGVLKDLSDQADSGVVRVGEPTFGEYDTTVNGDSATSTVCVDESKWGASVDGEMIADSTSGAPDPRAVTAILEKREAGWIVTDSAFDEEATCS